MTNEEKKYFLTEPFVKMGRWNLSPADSETWHTEHTSKVFKKVFGIAKGTLIIQDLKDNSEHAYFLKEYFERLFSRIEKLTSKDFRGLERIFLKFYPLKKKIKKALETSVLNDYKNSSNKQLVKVYKKNRALIHWIAAYDQLGWLTEDYWKKKMDQVLCSEVGLKKNSSEYYEAMFALGKPVHISTTLEEKRDVIRMAINLRIGAINMEKAARKLAAQYGYMPVATFGTPWTEEHYRQELGAVSKKPADKLKADYNTLLNYSRDQKKAFKAVVKKYKLTPGQVQVFIDFGLALDCRNEAEYVVSFGSFYLMPMYKEIARRLMLSVQQVRNLYEHEIVLALEGKIDAEECLVKKGKITGWGFDKKIKKRIFFNTIDAREIFEKLEKNINVQQSEAQQVGICASQGKAKGVVRIVINPTDNYKVKLGDIMIAHTTMVDFLPAMKNAGAVVTEVGGLTCHAAVVSREFGIPCVVSFKEATKIFKDGDMVEVVANDGIIRKI